MHSQSYQRNVLHLQQELLKSLKLERENIGVDLYGIQQQLARQQMLIEKEQVGLESVV